MITELKTNVISDFQTQRKEAKSVRPCNKRTAVGSIPRFGCLFCSKVVACGHSLCDLVPHKECHIKNDSHHRPS